jgi:hypothetical protein
MIRLAREKACTGGPAFHACNRSCFCSPSGNSWLASFSLATPSPQRPSVWKRSRVRRTNARLNCVVRDSARADLAKQNIARTGCALEGVKIQVFLNIYSTEPFQRHTPISVTEGAQHKNLSTEKIRSCGDDHTNICHREIKTVLTESVEVGGMKSSPPCNQQRYFRTIVFFNYFVPFC